MWINHGYEGKAEYPVLVKDGQRNKRMIHIGHHHQDELVPNASHPLVTLLKIQIPGKKILNSLTCPPFDQDNTDASSNSFFFFLPRLHRIGKDSRD